MGFNEIVNREGYNLGVGDFENYWGDELLEVEIIHFISGLIDTKKLQTARKIIHNIPDKTKINNAFSFQHINGRAGQYDFWIVKIKTKSGDVYSSKKRFYCSLSESDKNRVVLGVNGDSQMLYVAFPSSSGCSTKLDLE